MRGIRFLILLLFISAEVTVYAVDTCAIFASQDPVPPLKAYIDEVKYSFDIHDNVIAFIRTLKTEQVEELHAHFQKSAFKAQPQYGFYRSATEKALGLALQDETAWEWYIRDWLVIEGGTSRAQIYKWLEVIDKMPQSRKDFILKLVVANYARAKEKQDVQFYDMPSKRAFDLILRKLIPADQQFLQLAKSEGILKAYQNYLQQTTKLFKDTKYGHYKLEQVLAVMKAIQKYLRVGIENGVFPKDLVVVLGGSFPNGRADIALSDIDMIIENFKIATLFTDDGIMHRSSVLREAYNQMRQEIYQALKPHSSIALHLEDVMPPEDRNRTERRFGEITPFVFKISYDQAFLDYFGMSQFDKELKTPEPQGFEINLDEPPQPDGTDNLISYFSKLMEMGVMTSKDLQKLISHIKEKKEMINPLQENSDGKSDRYYHVQTIEEHLRHASVDQKKLLSWAEHLMQKSSAVKDVKNKINDKTSFPANLIEFHNIRMEPSINTEVNQKIKTDFAMMSTSVTQAMWMEVMKKNPSHFQGDGFANHPVENITWWSMAEFANRLSIKHNLQPVYNFEALQFKPGTSPEDGTWVPLKGVLKMNDPGNDIYQIDGYRLPTFAEYLYVSILAVKTPGFRMDAMFNLKEYASIQPQDHFVKTHSVAKWLPFIIQGHEFFDLFGNISELLHEFYDIKSVSAAPLKDISVPFDVAHRSYQVAGEPFRSNSGAIRYDPDLRRMSTGFRLVRSLPKK